MGSFKLSVDDIACCDLSDNQLITFSKSIGQLSKKFEEAYTLRCEEIIQIECDW